MSSSSCPPSRQPPKKQNRMYTSSSDDSYPQSYQSENQARYLDEEETYNLRIGTRTRGLLAGPMEPTLFLDRFLPQVQGGKAHPDFKGDAFTSVVMALKKIGRPLNTFYSSHELVTAVADAMEAHEIAFHDAGILHRDISPNNILITEQGRGMLIDWDLSLDMKTDNRKGGTPEFWSVALLTNPNHIQSDLDDRESALYVLLWNLLRYTPHNKMASLSSELTLFNVGTSHNARGDVRKELFLHNAHAELQFDNRPHLNRLIEEVAVTFAVRYAKPLSPGLRKILESCDEPSNPVVCERNIADRSWLVRTMRKYLEPRHEWPSDDEARENAIT